MIFKDFRDEIKETLIFCNFAPSLNECDDLFNNHNWCCATDPFVFMTVKI